MPVATNVLNLDDERHDFEVSIDGRGIVGGKIVKLINLHLDETSTTDIWHEIVARNDDNNGLTYIFRVVEGSTKKTYVGKTVNTMKGRYGAEWTNTTGGLRTLLDYYNTQLSTMSPPTLDVTIYNNSNPAMFEGVCFEILTKDAETFGVINRCDPC